MFGLGYPLQVMGLDVFLSGEVETGPTATHFGPACAQTQPYLPGTPLAANRVYYHKITAGRYNDNKMNKQNVIAFNNNDWPNVTVVVIIITA